MEGTNLTHIGIIQFDVYVGDITVNTFPSTVHSLTFNTLTGDISTGALQDIDLFVVEQQYNGVMANGVSGTTPTQFEIGCSNTDLSPQINVNDCTCAINNCGLHQVVGMSILEIILYIVMIVLAIIVIGVLIGVWCVRSPLKL